MRRRVPTLAMLGLSSVLEACGADPGPSPRDTDGGDDSGGVHDSGDDDPPGGPLLLCGGGTEGDVGDATAWSTAYAVLLEGGDVTGDGRVRVAVLADSEQTGWLPGYLEWLGADEAFNLTVATRAAARADDLAAVFADVDAVFLKGGDQGSYYDLWNDSPLETLILGVYAAGGAIGGTSAGAMSQSEYALAGGADYVSADVLLDSHTAWLDDVSDGGSGVHDDFLGLLPRTLVDTHFSVRGRLGRLAGALALAIDEGAPDDLLGIGLDERTCLRVRDGRALVSGAASAVFLRPGDEPALRVPGEPLVWSGLALDRLTAGWTYDLEAGSVDTADPPASAEPVAWDGTPESQEAADWSVSGVLRGDEERFEVVADRWPEAYGTHAGTRAPLLRDAVGFMDAHDAKMRGVNDEVAFRLLHDQPELTAFLVGADGAMRRPADTPDLVRLEAAADVPMATLILDASRVSWRSLSDQVSVEDAGDGGLHPAGLVGVRLHVLFTDGSDGRAWDLAHREPATP